MCAGKPTKGWQHTMIIRKIETGKMQRLFCQSMNANAGMDVTGEREDL